ncbi:MAG: hypothetical protein AVDCRST_MAG02-4189, partial [uncultured Rubrobacteraceae bacterium]
ADLDLRRQAHRRPGEPHRRVRAALLRRGGAPAHPPGKVPGRPGLRDQRRPGRRDRVRAGHDLGGPPGPAPAHRRGPRPALLAHPPVGEVRGRRDEGVHAGAL